MELTTITGLRLPSLDPADALLARPQAPPPHHTLPPHRSTTIIIIAVNHRHFNSWEHLNLDLRFELQQ